MRLKKERTRCCARICEIGNRDLLCSRAVPSEARVSMRTAVTRTRCFSAQPIAVAEVGALIGAHNPFTPKMAVWIRATPWPVQSTFIA